ncbi:MAG: hypothetical protein AAGA73_00740 [Pseudomonadota bacterium]
MSNVLARGDLVKPDIFARSQEAMGVPLYACYRKDAAFGPAMQWLIETMPKLLREVT